MANDIDKTSPHYKGEFGSIYEVNQKFPSGGVEGDYVAIDGWAHYWNADRGTWCVNAQRDSYWDELITGIIEKFKLFKGATYMGVAGLDTVPAKAIGAKMYYFATVAGTYKNFGGLVVPQGINVLYSENGSSWVCSTLLEVAQELGVSPRMVVSQKVVNDALNLKANQSSVNSALDKKADKETVNSALDKKADKETVNSALDKKADKETVNSALDKKADKAAINASLDLKANKSDVVKTNAAQDAEISRKANQQDVERSLNILRKEIGERTVVEGDVNNNPDEEDLTSKMGSNNREVLSLKDREYNPLEFSGKGYKILRKNIQEVTCAIIKIQVTKAPTTDGYVSIIINGVETHVDLVASTDNTVALVAKKIADKLSETMDEYVTSIDGALVTCIRRFGGDVTASSFSSVNTGSEATVCESSKTELRNLITAAMINQPNTIYEIRYDFDLDGKEITIQEGCTLKFEGGSLRNGKLLGFKHAQISNVNNKTIFLDINIDLYNEGTCQLEWFEHTEDDFSKALRLALQMFRRINLLNRQYTIRERNYELRTSTYVYGIANSRIYYDGDDVDVTNPYDISSYLFHILDYVQTTEYEGVTGGGFENINFTTRKKCNCIYSNCQGIFRNLAMFGFVRNIYITNTTDKPFNYYDGLLVSNVCTFPNSIINDNTLKIPYDVVFEGMANTAHINHLMVHGLYVKSLFSCSISDSSVHKMFISNSSVHFDGLHTEGPDRNDLYLSNSNVIIENSYLQFKYKSGLYISNDTILSYGNCGEMGVIIRNTIFSSSHDINENEPDYNININNNNWFHLILENVCYARRIDTPFLGVSGGIKIHFENKNYDFKNCYIDDLFNKYSIIYSKYCRFDYMNIFNSIRCVAPLYSSRAGLIRNGTSSDSRDIGDVYISVNYVFDLERKLYLSDNSFEKLDSNGKNSFRITRLFRDDIIKLLTPEILVSYDNVNVAKRLIAPITAQYAECYGNNIENYLFENIDISISELSKKNVIEWGETIPQSKNVRFKLKSDSAPTFGNFRNGDECILSNYKHIYYTNSKWVDVNID